MAEVELGLQGSLMVVGSLGSQVIGYQLIGAEIGEPQTERGVAAEKRGRLHGVPSRECNRGEDELVETLPQLYVGKTTVSEEVTGVIRWFRREIALDFAPPAAPDHAAAIVRWVGSRTKQSRLNQPSA
jgi:hypothetical protein